MLITNFIPYIAHLASGLALMMVFMAIYERLTPYREIQLIREGNIAAAMSFGGALVGFTLTLVSSALHAATWLDYLVWGCVAGAIQLLTFVLVAATVKQVKAHIENGNAAVGASLMFVSLATGALNAACLS